MLRNSTFKSPMKFRKKGPMESLPEVMGRVISEVACYQVIPFVRDVIGRFEVIVSVKPRMMIISVPAGNYVSNQHWQNKNQNRI